jgi:integrase
MPKVSTPLSNSKIKSAKAKDKEYTLSDTNGLSIIIKPNGSKLWIFRYTSPINKKRKKTSYGNYPTTTLKIARDNRDRDLSLIAQGIDPIEKKSEDIKDIKASIDGEFEKVMYEWLDREAKKTSETTHNTKVRRLERDVLPLFKNRHIKDIKHKEIVDLIKNKQRATEETANRIYRILEKIWKFAVTCGYCENSVFMNIDKESIIHKRVKKHYPKITDEKILKEFVNSIYNYHGSHIIRASILFAIHLPLRAENLCNLKWEYIDFDKKLLTIPRELMKAKNPNLPDFIMPLTDSVINILSEIKPYTSHTEYIFTENKHKPINPVSPNRAIERMGYNDENQGRKTRLHGLRGTFRSIVETHNISTYEAKERALDHHEKSPTVRAYQHKANYYTQLKELMEWWSRYIDNMIDKV